MYACAGLLLCVFKIGEQLLQDRRAAGRHGGSGVFGGAAGQGYTFSQRFVLGTALHLHHKINHVQTPAVRPAVRTEARRRVRLVVHLQTRRLVIMEGTMQPKVLVRLQPVMLQHLGQRQLRLDLSDFHRQPRW